MPAPGRRWDRAWNRVNACMTLQPQRCGSSIVEALTRPGASPPKMTESPDRAVDAQTPAREDALGPEADA